MSKKNNTIYLMLSGSDAIATDGKCVKIAFKCLFENKFWVMATIWGFHDMIYYEKKIKEKEKYSLRKVYF